MKKILLMMAAVIALSLTSCQQDYKQQGETMAKQLDELCQKQDSAAVLKLDGQIRDIMADLEAAGDTAGINAFRTALKDARERNAAYISTLKLNTGESKDSVGKEIINDALSGDVDIDAVTSSIDAMIEKEAKKK